MKYFIPDSLHPLGASVADPGICSSRLCQHDESWPVAFWITRKEVEGCDCCLLANGTMVPDGATWLDYSVKPPQLLECCGGQIVVPVTVNQTEPPPPPCGEYGGDVVRSSYCSQQQYITVCFQE